MLSESPVDTGGPSSNGYLGRLLDLLDVIGAADGLTLTEIAERAGVPLSTAHRLTSLLLERHWVTRAEASKRFLPGRNLELIGLRAARWMTVRDARRHSPGRIRLSLSQSAILRFRTRYCPSK